MTSPLDGLFKAIDKFADDLEAEAPKADWGVKHAKKAKR